MTSCLKLACACFGICLCHETDSEGGLPITDAFTAEYVAQFATESQARKHDKQNDTDDEEEKQAGGKQAEDNDGFLPDSDDEEDPPTTGKMTI